MRGILHTLHQHLPFLLLGLFADKEIPPENLKECKLLYGNWLRTYHHQMLLQRAVYKYSWNAEEAKQLDSIQKAGLLSVQANMEHNSRLVRPFHKTSTPLAHPRANRGSQGRCLGGTHRQCGRLRVFV